ncbi:magnesium transporter [Pseudorhodobacter sp.]|uniref:magnesium transporter n=1 Tax=Pseudorhodobacter sp. TaxID=1934400 RepID=UPI002649A898|nr:magnesium transporter [Pseudorhodobacter sp.]MDN5786595.1 magnesium transporter [Pseudorhodobacter sp.]
MTENEPPEIAAMAADISDFFQSAHPFDLAVWLNQLPVAQASGHLADIPLPRRAKVFAHLARDRQVDLAQALTPNDFAEMVAQMDADDRADLFNLLPRAAQHQLIHDLKQEDCENIRSLSAYPEGSAGAIMTTDYAVLEAGMTAAQAIDALRCMGPGRETIYRSYVLDGDRRLIGSVRLHELILADEATPISNFMDKALKTVTPTTDREDVAKMIAQYDLFAVPVIEADGRVVGIVTHDDATDAMQAEMTEDFQKISTVLPFTQSLRQAGIRVLYSKRIVWLALLIFGNLFSGAGIAYFEDMILAYVSLVFFLPLLIDSSGNAGSQSATLMVRALATGDVELKDWRDLILRELIVAAALGATMALVVFPVGALRGGPEIALTVGLTMFVVVIIGSLVGMSLPFLLSRLRLDPATASGPLVTTISDGMGVLIYFSIASVVLGL